MSDFRTMPLHDRIRAALERIRNGQCTMRVPADQTDPDLVLADCLAALTESPSAVAVASRDEIIERALTQFAQCISVLAGQDMTRAEVMVAESRPVLWDAIRALKNAAPQADTEAKASVGSGSPAVAAHEHPLVEFADKLILARGFVERCRPAAKAYIAKARDALAKIDGGVLQEGYRKVCQMDLARAEDLLAEIDDVLEGRTGTPSPIAGTSDMVPLGTISECPSCGGDGKLTFDEPGKFGPCWRCGGSGRVMAYRETTEQFDARMKKVRAFTDACQAPSTEECTSPRQYWEQGVSDAITYLGGSTFGAGEMETVRGCLALLRSLKENSLCGPRPQSLSSSTKCTPDAINELLDLPRHSIVGDPLHGPAMAERKGGRWLCYDDVEAWAARARNAIPSATRVESEDAACKVAADLLRNEIVRLEKPKAMFPQEAEKIGRRQDAFQQAARYLDPEPAPTSTGSEIK